MSKDVKNDHTDHFVGMEDDEEQAMNVVGKEMWLDREQENMLDDVNEASIFYTDFPPLPDFSCMSSSSSCSSSSSSSSSAPPAKVRTALSSTSSMEVYQASEEDAVDVDCVNVMENLGYVDLIDGDDIWDSSSIFQSENYQQQEQKIISMEGLPQDDPNKQLNCNGGDEEEDDNGGFCFLQDTELAVIFFEWLKQNKDHISAEDMRSIKLKRATVESASKRLGSTKEGKKQLLKLILEWVEQCQRQKKRMREAAEFQEPIQNPSVAPPDPTAACFSPPSWMVAPPPPQYVPEWSPSVAPPSVFPPGMGYIGNDPYAQGVSVPPLIQPFSGNLYLSSPEFQAMENAQSWQPSPIALPAQYATFPDNSSFSPGQPPQANYGSEYPYQLFDGNGDRLIRLGSSATKEARKKRMARQRRLSVHHYRHQARANQNQNQSIDQPQARISGAAAANCCLTSPASPAGSWVYWPSTIAAPPVSATMAAVGPSADASQLIPTERPPMQPQNNQRPASSAARRQGWKTEKSLRFLLQKVLKQSDVGNLGRIVLPKKEAEIHLPELDSRDGIPIAMEDIGTSRVWNMRYRFWPNNKSRMYILENTGEFVRANGLQEGDFIVLYSDIKCGKYLIRGVKVRQPAPGIKSEGKKPARRNPRNIAPALEASPLPPPIKQAMK